MAFTFTNYAGIQPQASPFQDMIGKILGGYGDMTKAKYLEPSLAEELKKAKLFNEYYGPNIESEMGLRKAQTGEAGARTGLIGEQNKGARIENQYMPEKMKAAIAELQANVQKAKLFNEYYGPNIESEMGLRKAQTGEAGARTGLIGEQNKGARIENQYMPEKMKAAIAELQANVQKAKLFNEYYGPNIESEMGLRKAQTGEAGARTGLIGEQNKGARIENQYMPEKMKAAIAELQANVQKAKLFNEYYGPNIESEMGLRKAQTGEAGARTGLIGEQNKGARIENQYIPEKMKAAIAELQANVQKAHLLQMIREQMMGGMGNAQGGAQMGAPSGSQMPMFGGQGMPSQMQGQPQGQGAPMPMQNQQQGGQQQTTPGLDYAKAATAMQALGLGKPHVVDANGRYMAITPFGNFDTGVAGLSQRDTALAKEDAKKISALENIVLSGSQKQETFNELNKDLGSHEFESIRQNPILGRHELGWYEKFGTPEQQQMIGRMKTHMGNIVKDSSRDFAGQFRVGEQALLNDMKPNISDSIDTMKGKAEALTYMNQLMTKRAEMEADFMRNYNMSALQAKIAADKQIDPKEIKKEIKTILHPASSQKNNFTQSDLEFTAKKHGMTVDEVRKKLESR